MSENLEEHMHHPVTEKSRREYIKFALVIVFILLVSGLLAYWRGGALARFLSDFMGVFLITFAIFKFLSLEMFAIAYRSYDIVAKKYPAWAFVFPFVEGLLGCMYLITEGNTLLNLITMVITGIATVGVWQELHPKVRRMHRVQCACLGTIIKLPLSTTSLVEDVLMFVMAAVMLFV